jgi:cysteine desulfurase
LLDVDKSGALLGTLNGAPIDNVSKHGLIALQAANSETGILQKTLPLAQNIWSASQNNLIMVDAVQVWGKTPYSVDRSGGDYVLLSGHKFGAPTGVGALYLKAGLDTRRIVKGGGQEEGRRSGTENLLGIVGLGAAAVAAKIELTSGIWDHVQELRNNMETRIADIASDVIFVGRDAERLVNTSCFAVPGWKGETQVMQMDIAGFAISAGSACSSGKVKTSRVLKTMGFDDITAASAVRISLGPTTTADEVDRFVNAWARAYEKFAARAA